MSTDEADSSPTVTEAPHRARPRLLAVAGVFVVVGTVGAFVASNLLGDGDEPERIVTHVTDPVAPTALADGGFLYAERTTGRILRSTREGEVTEAVHVAGELRTDGERGVLGLEVRRHGVGTEVYASWTRAEDSRLVVGRFVEDRQELVWEGPVSTDLANGGTLAFRGPQLLIAVGELQDPDAVGDPATPNGKVLALDPDGDASQTPEVVASGWHNPFAMDVVDGAVWLFDNSPGDEAERLARIPASGDAQVLELGKRRAPSGLDVLPDGDLVVCGFRTRVVERIPTPETGLVAPTEVLGPPCLTGVTVLADGSIVTTTSDAIWRDPGP